MSRSARRRRTSRCSDLRWHRRRRRAQQAIEFDAADWVLRRFARRHAVERGTGSSIQRSSCSCRYSAITASATSHLGIVAERDAVVGEAPQQLRDRHRLVAEGSGGGTPDGVEAGDRAGHRIIAATRERRRFRGESWRRARHPRRRWSRSSSTPVSATDGRPARAADARTDRSDGRPRRKRNPMFAVRASTVRSKRASSASIFRSKRSSNAAKRKSRVWFVNQIVHPPGGRSIRISAPLTRTSSSSRALQTSSGSSSTVIASPTRLVVSGEEARHQRLPAPQLYRLATTLIPGHTVGVGVTSPHLDARQRGIERRRTCRCGGPGNVPGERRRRLPNGTGDLEVHHDRHPQPARRCTRSPTTTPPSPPHSKTCRCRCCCARWCT